MRAMRQTAWLKRLTCMLRATMQWGQAMILGRGLLLIDGLRCDDTNEVVCDESRVGV